MKTRMRLIASAAFVLAALVGSKASPYPSGDGTKPGDEEIARLTELGKKITNLTKEDLLRLEEVAPPAPTEFAVVLNNGYGGADDYPKTVDKFEQLLISMTNSGYNTLFAPYKEWRVPLMRKHGVKYMIDIVAWFDDAQNDIRDPRMWQRPRVKEICERVRNDRAVWGYNLFNEPIDQYFKGGGDMKPRDFKGVEIDVCGDCGAVLLDPGELEQLAGSDRSNAFSELAAMLRFRGR